MRALRFGNEADTQLFLRLRDDFQELKAVGEATDSIISGVNIEYYSGDFLLKIQGNPRVRVYFLDTIMAGMYLEVGRDGYTCTATRALPFSIIPCIGLVQAIAATLIRFLSLPQFITRPDEYEDQA